jgi:hypothetical protein
MPLELLAETTPKGKRQPFSIPLHEEVAKCAESLAVNFERHRTFIYQSLSGQNVFNVYDKHGNPTFNELILVAYCPLGAEKDFDGGRVAGLNELMIHPLGSRSYGLPVSRQDTPESIRNKIRAALKKVAA